MMMPGRKYQAGSGYSYGFNGKENDNSTGEGNLDFGARILDVRLGGRWLSVDPLQRKYPAETPYLYTGGNPILFKDPDGKDRIVSVYGITASGDRLLLSQTTYKDVFTYGTYEGSNIFSPRYNYKADIQETITIDLSKNVTKDNIISSKITEGARTPISIGDRALVPLLSWFNKQSEGEGSTQDQGYVFTGNKDGTMEFKDHAGNIIGTVDLEIFLFGMKLYKPSGASGSITNPTLDKIVKTVKALDKNAQVDYKISDQVDEVMGSGGSPATSPLNTKQKPVEKSTPERPGEGWQIYIHDKKGGLKESARTSGMQDSTVPGKNGAPDTIYHRPYKTPATPKKDIKRKG